MDKFDDAVWNDVAVLLDDKVGFIGPYILNQQLKAASGPNGSKLTPEQYHQIIKMVMISVEALFGKKRATEVHGEIKNILPKMEINIDDYPMLKKE